MKRTYYKAFCAIILLLILFLWAKDLAAIEKREYFEKGILQLTATDNDGWARVKTYVNRWDDEKRRWDSVISEVYTRDGRCDYSLSPGVYQLIMYYQEATPNTKRTIEGIQINDRTVIEKEEYFEKGILQLTATDNDGWARVKTYVNRWDDEKRRWDSVISEVYTRDGRCDYSLSPGVYQLIMYYQEATPNTKKAIDEIHVLDRWAISLGEMFGGGNLPPIISASGPFEIGDGDGFYEIGEKILFRIEIQDSDLESIQFMLNDHILRTIEATGKYEQVINLNILGECRFAIRARDRNGTLETYLRNIPVSMQKDMGKRSTSFLPSNYGGKVNIKICPKCNKEYSMDTVFCPQDGAKLNIIEKVAHGLMNAGLVGAGINPTTPEAQHTKKFALDWLNPFSSSKEIDKDVQRLIDDVIGD